MRVGLKSSNLKNVDPREMLFNLMEEIVEVKVVLNMSLSLYREIKLNFCAMSQNLLLEIDSSL